MAVPRESGVVPPSVLPEHVYVNVSRTCTPRVRIPNVYQTYTSRVRPVHAPMALPPKETAEARIPITGRVPQSVVTRLKERAARSGHSRSAAMAELLELALDLDEGLKPFRPAIERLMSEERLSLAEAVVRLMWMGVELNPRPPSDSEH
jgi:hypothetical protein